MIGEPGLTVALQTLRHEDAPGARERVIHVGVNQDVVVFNPMVDFISRARHARSDYFSGVFGARTQTPLKLGH